MFEHALCGIGMVWWCGDGRNVLCTSFSYRPFFFILIALTAEVGSHRSHSSPVWYHWYFAVSPIFLVKVHIWINFSLLFDFFRCSVSRASIVSRFTPVISLVWRREIVEIYCDEGKTIRWSFKKTRVHQANPLFLLQYTDRLWQTHTGW